MGSNNGKPVMREEDIAALSKSSGLDAAEVRETFESFIAEHPNGKLKPKDFLEMMAKAVPKKDAAKMEKHVFRMYVSDKDGFIDFTEFMLVFHIMSDGTVEEVLTKIFRVFDVNGDGVISSKEMNKLIKDMYGLLKTEDPNIAAKDMIAKTAFAEMDKNKDGKVTKEEFVAACLGQQEISKMLALKIVDIFVEDDQ
jgi:Ca2+-binding EF-hand superfamily protein